MPSETHSFAGEVLPVLAFDGLPGMGAPKMSKLQALREKKTAGAKAICALRDKLNAEGYAETAEDAANWEKANADYNATLKAINYEETAERVTAEANASNNRIAPFIADHPEAARGGDRSELAVDDKTRIQALQGWIRAFDDRGMSAAQEAACRAIGVNPLSKSIGIDLFCTEDFNRLQSRYRSHHPAHARDRIQDFKATLGTGSGPSGGYLIAPEQMRTNLEINMLAYGGVRQVAETIRTSTGEPLSWPTADDTSNTGVQLGESTSIGSSVDPSFAKVLWGSYKFSSKVILVPFELLQDSVFNLAAVLGDMLGERLGRITNTKFTTGTGAATCKGIVTCATSFAAASATAIAGDDLLGLIHSVDPAYRQGAGFMMNDAIVLALRKLKDGQGNYLWQSGLRDGAPDRILGYGLTVNQDMDSTVSSGKKSILFGQLSKYKIRTIGEVRLKRLDERYADTDQTAFLALTREDGNLLTAGTAPVKYLSH